MQNEIFQHLEYLIKTNKYKLLKEELEKFHNVDIAEFLSEIDEIEALAVFRLLPAQTAIDTFSYLDSDVQETFISGMTSAETVKLVDSMYIDDMVDIIEQMPDSIVRKIMQNTPKEKRDIFNEYLNYPKHSAGSIMTPNFFAISDEITVKELLKEFRSLTEMDETFYTIYITDKENRLKGYVEIRDVLTSDPDTKISEITYEDIIYAETHDDQETVSKLLEKYQFLSIPIVDRQMKLVGVVTFDDAIQVLHDEAEEDFQKMAAITPSEKEYLDTGVIELAKQRFLWLLLLMFSSTISQFVINGFNDVITAVTGIIAFMPMLTDSAGNAGSQSSTTIIRGLSVGELETKDALRILAKEFFIALIVGGGLAIINFVRILIFNPGEFMLSFTVSVSLLITIVLAKLFGSILPIVAQKIKVDPTIMAAPLLTTVVDSVALYIYFILAGLWLM